MPVVITIVIRTPFVLAEVIGNSSREYVIEPGIYQLEITPNPLVPDSKKKWLILARHDTLVGATTDWWLENITCVAEEFGTFGNAQNEENTWINWA